MAGAAAIWIVRFGEPANAIIPAAAPIGLVAIGAHARNVDRKTDAAADFPHASPGDVSPHEEQ
jgi:hypothetical protein